MCRRYPALSKFVDSIVDFLPLPQVESPIPPGKKRVRWRCVRVNPVRLSILKELHKQCGKMLFDDFDELEPGAIEQLEQQLQSEANPNAETLDLRQ